MLATFAGGCFWCTEAVFKRLKGVDGVVSGYSGGDKPNPTYEEVSAGTSGYAEAVQINFDAAIISYETLLDVFFTVHDPTTLNMQGNDVGTQYRSAIFYHDESQKNTAERKIKELDASGKYPNKVVTEVTEYTNFYKAEEYHLDFYDRNRNYGYCTLIIDPKIQKLYKEFKEKIKEE